MLMGFSVYIQNGAERFAIHTRQSDAPSDLLSWKQSGTATAMLLGRIYYQGDMLARLSPYRREAFRPRRPVNPAALALAIYHEQALPGLQKLEGDFALAIWDDRQTQLVAMRDPMGGYPLFWVNHKDTVALGTCMRPLVHLLPERRLNPLYVAEYLMAPGQRNEAPGEACVYHDVHRIAPGELLVINAATHHPQRCQYWDWWQQRSVLTSSNLQDAAAQYRALLREAVCERLTGRTLAHVSGGMDSTSVALLALDAIDAGHGTPPLHTLSLVYERLPKLARERPYIEAILPREPRWVPHLVPVDEVLDFDAFLDAPWHDEPYPGLWRLALDRVTVATAAELGASTILTGSGADDLLALQPYHLADLLRHGRLLHAWGEAGPWARARNCSRWAILHDFGFAVLTAGRTRLRGARGWLCKRPLALHEHDDWTISPWIVRDFARAYALTRRAQHNARRVYRRCPSTAGSVALDAVESRPGDVLRWAVAAPLGISVAHPFLDPRLIAFGLGMLSRVPPDPHRQKPVLAEAMREVLPDAIRLRRSKGHFDELFYLGLAKNLPQLEAMIHAAPLEQVDVFDRAVLLQALQQASLGVANARQLYRLTLSLTLIQWLSMQAAPFPVIESIDPFRRERASEPASAAPPGCAR
jgi:asparagine synthase (glutamine-hydrolysing)